MYIKVRLNGDLCVCMVYGLFWKKKSRTGFVRPLEIQELRKVLNASVF